MSLLWAIRASGKPCERIEKNMLSGVSSPLSLMVMAFFLCVVLGAASALLKGKTGIVIGRSGLFVFTVLLLVIPFYIHEIQVLAVAAGMIILMLIEGYHEKPEKRSWKSLMFLTLSMCIVWSAGLRIHFLSRPGFDGVWFLNQSSMIITVLWLILQIRAFEITFMLPGLSEGVLIMLLTVFMTLAMHQGLMAAAALASVVIGTQLGLSMLGTIDGFPKRLINTGPVIQGFLLGAIAIMSMSKSLATLAIIVPIIIFIVPSILIAGILTLAYHKGSIAGSRAEHELGRNLCWTVNPVRIVLLTYFACGWLTIIFAAFIFQLRWELIVLIFSLTTVLLVILYRLLLLEKGGGATAHIDNESEAGGNSPARADILGVKVDRLDMDGAVASVSRRLTEGPPGYIVTPNGLIIDMAVNDPEYCEILNNAFLSVPDGAGLVWAADLMGCAVPERVPGIDLLTSVLKHMAVKCQKVYLLGAQQEIIERAAEEIHERFAGLDICGFHHGYFKDGSEEEKNIIKEIQELNPDLLVVALGVPRQEIWMQKHHKSVGAMVSIGVGGALDVMAGHTVRAPQWVGYMGLEWLWRLIRQPGRLYRMAGLPRFVIHVLENCIGQCPDYSHVDDAGDVVR